MSARDELTEVGRVLHDWAESGEHHCDGYCLEWNEASRLVLAWLATKANDGRLLVRVATETGRLYPECDPIVRAFVAALTEEAS